MLRQRAERIVRNVFCATPELRPRVWDFVEPARRPFDVKDVVDALEAPEPGACSTKPFFLRTEQPRFCASVMFHNGPASRPCHNRLDIDLESRWEGGDRELAGLIPNALAPEFPDYGYVANAGRLDQDRYNELRGPLTPAELMAVPRLAPPFVVAPPTSHRADGPFAWFHPDTDFMLGPNGFLWDVVWFNYFGRPYVELIGEQRLRAAGWARVEDMDDGLACFATGGIDDADSFNRRARIRDALSEFVWTPGCRREDKRAPTFDFSEQIGAIPPVAATTFPLGARPVELVGFTEEEKRQAVKAFEEQTGMVYDAHTGMLLPRDGKSEV